MLHLINSQTLKQLTFERFDDFLSQYLKDDLAVLEVGAGEGQLAEKLNNDFKLDYYIFDLADDRQMAKQLPFKIVDIAHDRFPLTDQSVDIILGAQVLEHLENMSHFFRECYRVLKPGGRIVLRSPNFSSLFQRLIYLKNGKPVRLDGKISNGGHINFFTYKYLKYFTGDLFSLEKVEGDILVDTIFGPKISSLLKKKVHFLADPKIKNPFFSYNILLVFRKK